VIETLLTTWDDDDSDVYWTLQVSGKYCGNLLVRCCVFTATLMMVQSLDFFFLCALQIT
jgi:hypothetical protein